MASKNEKPKTDFKRLTINLAPEVHAELTARADRRGITITELIRRAVALDLFIEENSQGNGRILVERDDKLREVVLI